MRRASSGDETHRVSTQGCGQGGARRGARASGTDAAADDIPQHRHSIERTCGRASVPPCLLCPC
eukprot:2954415-Alexandrium_andersonii.AAC.1